MAEIYFQCPLCKQRLSVQTDAAGMLLDCPTCRSTLVVPPKSNEVPKVEVPRRMTVFGNSQAELYEEIERTRGLVFKEHERTLAARAEAEKLKEELLKAREEAEQAKEAAKRAEADIEILKTEATRASSTQASNGGEAKTDRSQEAQVEELVRIREDAEKARAEASRLQETEKALKLALEKMQSDLTSAIHDRDTVATRLAAAELNQGQAKEAQAELADLRQEVKAVTELRDEFRIQAEKAEASCNSLQERLGSVDKERAELKAHIALLQVQFEESVGVRRRYETLQQQVGKLNQRLEALVSERDTLRLNIGQAEVEMKNLRARVETANTEASKQREEAVAVELQRFTAENSNELAEAKKELLELNQERDALKGELEKIRKELQTVMAEREEIAIKREELAKQGEKQDAMLKDGSNGAQSLPAEIEDLRKNAVQAQQDRERLKAEVEKVTQTSREAQKRVDALQEELRTRQLAFAALNERIAVLTSERDKARKEFGEQESAASEARTKLAAIEAERNRLMQDSHAKAAEAVEEIKHLKAELVSAIREGSDGKQHLASLQEQLRSQEKELSSVNERVALLTAECEKARNELAERDAAMKEAHAKVTALEGERDRLKAEIATGAAGSNDIQKQLDALRDQLKSKETELTAANERIVSVTGERDHARKEVSERDAVMKGAQAKVAGLEVDRDRLKAEIAKATAGSDDVQKQLDALREQLKGRETELTAANERVTSLAAERDQARKECGEKEDAVKDALAKVSAVETERKLLQNAVKNFSSKHEAQAQSTGLIQEKVNTLERELKASRGALEESHQALEKAKAEHEKTKQALVAAENSVREGATKLAQAAHAERTYKSLIEQTEQAFEEERQKLQPLIDSKARLADELKRAQEEQQRAAKLSEGAERETAALVANIARLEARLAELQAQLRNVTEDRDRARIEIEAVNAGLERAKQHVTVLQARRDQMRDEISRLKMSLGMAPELDG